jgi:hypothetical protein
LARGRHDLVSVNVLASRLEVVILVAD